MSHEYFSRILKATLVEIRVILFQVQEWIWTGSCKELLFFPEETKIPGRSV